MNPTLLYQIADIICKATVGTIALIGLYRLGRAISMLAYVAASNQSRAKYDNLKQILTPPSAAEKPKSTFHIPDILHPITDD